jgi:hypothetical protein
LQLVQLSKTEHNRVTEKSRVTLRCLRSGNSMPQRFARTPDLVVPLATASGEVPGQMLGEVASIGFGAVARADPGRTCLVPR